MRIANVSLFLIIWILSAAALCSCSSRGDPPPIGRKVSVILRFDTGMPVFFGRDSCIYHIRNDFPGENIIRRYLIRAYPETGDNRSEPMAEWKFYLGNTTDPDCTIELKRCPTESCRLVIWSDYVADTFSDMHYRTDDFSDILLLGDNGHSGSDESRDVFRGSGSVNQSQDSTIIMMSRPTAKYIITATNLKTILEADDSPGKSVNGKPDWFRYAARIFYTGYMPCAYNLFGDHPSDSRTGVSFESSLRQLGKDELRLGYDYVFVNNYATAVTLYIGIFRRDTGKLLAEIPSLEVPLEREGKTILEVPLQHPGGGGGPGIDPSFDGTINVPVD